MKLWLLVLLSFIPEVISCAFEIGTCGPPIYEKSGICFCRGIFGICEACFIPDDHPLVIFIFLGSLVVGISLLIALCLQCAKRKDPSILGIVYPSQAMIPLTTVPRENPQSGVPTSETIYISQQQ